METRYAPHVSNNAKDQLRKKQLTSRAVVLQLWSVDPKGSATRCQGFR